MADVQNVGRSEQRYNAAMYKSSHNSYDRNESLAQQLDDYNVWQLELDIYDYLEELKVNHNCDPASISRADSLETLLGRLIAESKTYQTKFTMIYLDMKGNGLEGCLIANWGSELNSRLKKVFINVLGQQHIYPSSEFIVTDQLSWPSFQHLNSRGYYWCVVIDWHGETPDNAKSDPLFFSATSTMPTGNELFTDNTVLVCTDGGCNSFPTGLLPVIRDKRWIYRIYPAGACAGDCGQQNGAYWQNAIEKKYNLIASNCVNRAQTFDALTHSPSPLYVDCNAVNSCPINNETCEWGTHGFPFNHLADGINRASPMVVLLVAAGEYKLRNPGAGYLINKPIILRAVNGIVTIR